jgi:hypothetical protein
MPYMPAGFIVAHTTDTLLGKISVKTKNVFYSFILHAGNNIRNTIVGIRNTITIVSLPL